MSDAHTRHDDVIKCKTFSALLAICAGNSLVPVEFPAQTPVTRSFDAFFDLRLNKRLSKQLWSWWFEKLSCPLWRHCNELQEYHDGMMQWKWFLHYWPCQRGIHQSLVDSTHKCQWWRALFSLLLASTNCWTINHVAIDFRCHDAYVISHLCRVQSICT